jgi:hypothetical protein
MYEIHDYIYKSIKESNNLSSVELLKVISLILHMYYETFYTPAYAITLIQRLLENKKI